MSRLFQVLVLTIAATALLSGQSSRSTITGVVTDASGATIPDAAVTAVNLATQVNYTAKTNEAGIYAIQQAPEGFYKVQVDKTGFQSVVFERVELTLAQTRTLDASLALGQTSQSVEVAANTPALQTSTSEVATSVTQKQVLDLPLSVAGNMRNPEQFLFLTPGVTGTVGNTQINGSQSRGKEVLLDGIGSTSPESGGTLFSYPSVEAISEFQLLGANFNAEYGRTGGGFEIFTTRSGTNDFHGSAFDYLRNDVFDARGYFAKKTPVNRQNEYGIVFGGPVWIPKVYNGRNKTFFHFVWSGFRYRQGATNQLVGIAPLAFRNGDFSGLVDAKGNKIVIYDPATTQVVNGKTVRTAFPNNMIPPSRFSAVSKNILPLLPNPTNGGLLGNFLAIGATAVDKDQIDIKLDHSFSERHRVNGFLYHGAYPTTNPAVIPEPLGSAWVNRYDSYWARFADDFIVSPNKVNNLNLGFTRERQSFYGLTANQGWAQKIGLAGVSTTSGNAFPQVTFSDGYYPFGSTNGSKSSGLQANNTFQVTDGFSWIAGAHSLKFGVDLRWLQTNGADFFNSQGTFAFSPNETGLPGGAGSSGNSFASFLLGAVDSGSRNVLGYVPSNRYDYAAGYVQDNWKVSRKLALNYGLRYDVFLPRREAHNNLSSFDPAIPNPNAGGLPGAVSFLGDGPGRTGRTSFARTSYMNFGPRIGLAYALNDRTAIHTGYGIYYAPGNATTGLRKSQDYSYGFSASPTFATTNAGVTPAFNWDNGLPQNFITPPVIAPTVANGSNVSAMFPGDGRPPYFQNWSFDVQRELPGSWVVNTTYVGVKGTRLGTNLITLNQLNPKYLSLGSLLTQPVTSPAAVAAGIPIPYAGFKGSVAQSLRPYPQYLSIADVAAPNGNSTYNALQVKAQKRYSYGLTVLAAYTWAKSISDGEVQAGGGPSGQDYYNRRLEKALSIDDVPQALALSYVWDLPTGRGKGLVRVLTAGWTFTGIQQYSAGTPLVLSVNNTLPLFNQSLRPNVVLGVPMTLDRTHFDPQTSRFINAAAFTIPAPYTFGNAARDYGQLRGFPFLNESFGLIKRTALGEHANLTFRVEFFNVFNRVQFGNPATNVSASNFGVVSSQANAPRQGQMALRLDF